MMRSPAYSAYLQKRHSLYLKTQIYPSQRLQETDHQLDCDPLYSALFQSSINKSDATDACSLMILVTALKNSNIEERTKKLWFTQHALFKLHFIKTRNPEPACIKILDCFTSMLTRISNDLVDVINSSAYLELVEKIPFKKIYTGDSVQGGGDDFQYLVRMLEDLEGHENKYLIDNINIKVTELRVSGKSAHHQHIKEIVLAHSKQIRSGVNELFSEHLGVTNEKKEYYKDYPCYIIVLDNMVNLYLDIKKFNKESRTRITDPALIVATRIAQDYANKQTEKMLSLIEMISILNVIIPEEKTVKNVEPLPSEEANSFFEEKRQAYEKWRDEQKKGALANKNKRKNEMLEIIKKSKVISNKAELPPSPITPNESSLIKEKLAHLGNTQRKTLCAFVVDMDDTIQVTAESLKELTINLGGIASKKKHHKLQIPCTDQSGYITCTLSDHASSGGHNARYLDQVYVYQYILALQQAGFDRRKSGILELFSQKPQAQQKPNFC